MAGTLATWIVEFDASSAKSVEAALANLLNQLKGASAAQTAMNAQGLAGATAAAKSYQTLRSQVRELAAAFGIAGGGLALFRAGLAGTGDAQRLGFIIQQIAREFTSIFLPAIRAVTSNLQDLLGWFRSLTGEQQALISKLVLVTIGIKALNAAIAASPVYGFLAAFTILVSMADALGTALAPLRVIFNFFADTGIGAFILDMVILTAASYALMVALRALGKAGLDAGFGIAAGMVSATAGVVSLSGAMRGLQAAMGPIGWISLALGAIGASFMASNRKSERNRIGEQGGGAEDFEQMWFRIQRIATNTDVPLQQLRQLEIIASNTGRRLQNANQGLALT